MKTNLFVLILGMLCLYSSAFSQSNTLTGFNGKIQFSSFANNGLYIRGTLDAFVDQTNQYSASDVDTADVVWDNLGRRYSVVGVISSNLTQAVVDLSRIGGGSHIPTGVGFVSRETSNGLSLLPTTNSAGISNQLQGRVLTHNMKILEGLKTIYTGSDSLRKPEIFVKMDSVGNQTFFLGYMLSFPDRNYDNIEYGLYISPEYYGELTLMFKKDYLTMYNGEIDLVSSSNTNSYTASINLKGDQHRMRFYTRNKSGINATTLNIDTSNVNFNIYGFQTMESKYDLFNITCVPGSNIAHISAQDSFIQLRYSRPGDHLKFNVNSNSFEFSGERLTIPFSYKLPIINPSLTVNARSNLSWVGTGSSTIPSFIRSQYGVSSGTTDVSGDLTITVPTMPDATYSANITVEGTTSYTVSVHTKITTTFKVRFFNPTTGAAVASTAVSCSYKIEDY